MVWQYQSTSIKTYSQLSILGLFSACLSTLVNSWKMITLYIAAFSVHTCIFVQWELIFTRLFCLAKKQKLAPCIRNWLYGVYIYILYKNNLNIMNLKGSRNWSLLQKVRKPGREQALASIAIKSKATRWKTCTCQHWPLTNLSS